MVLDQGRIIERGSYESLLAKKGVYYQLYTGALRWTDPKSAYETKSTEIDQYFFV